MAKSQKFSTKQVVVDLAVVWTTIISQGDNELNSDYTETEDSEANIESDDVGESAHTSVNNHGKKIYFYCCKCFKIK